MSLATALESPAVGALPLAGEPPGAHLVRDGLLMDLETMVARLEHELTRGSHLNSFLLAAGIAQITDDYLHPIVYPFDPAAAFLRGFDGGLARTATVGASGVAGLTRAARVLSRPTRTVLCWRRELQSVIDPIAEVEVQRRARLDRGVIEHALGWAGCAQRLPRKLREAPGRLPACFAHFDQRPADVMQLADRFAGRRVALDRPLVVVGVRTSGSYLAPLCAAALRGTGYQAVHWLTVRPGRPPLRHERAVLAAVAHDRGAALVIDDPPVTGSSLTQVAESLERTGFGAESVWLLLALFGESELPAPLQRYRAVLLASHEWSARGDLDPGSVARTLGEMTGATGLEVVPSVPGGDGSIRGHVSRRYCVRTPGGSGAPRGFDLLVEGIGLGYFGAHRIASHQLVTEFSPPVLGLRDGLLYRHWLPQARRADALGPDREAAVAFSIARYVATRRDALPVGADLTLRMAGQQPAWEVAGRVLARAFGRIWPLAQLLLTNRVAKRVLRTPRPSVVDGNTGLSQWYSGQDFDGSLLKPDVGEDRFSNLCPPCFDAAFDLAAATARTNSLTLPARLREAFYELGGDWVSPERWLLYELVHLWSWQRTQPLQAAALARDGARALQRYFASSYLADVSRCADGPLCALDLDGVLELDQFGFPGLTPASALSLRALLVHGFRPVLATGRSLGEVRERCRAYGLAGGVAEYGAAAFVTAGGLELAEDPPPAMNRLRAELSATDGVEVDGDYRFSIRASVVERGTRSGLSEELARAVLARPGASAVQVIVGEGQTDFVAPGVDKATGLRTLARAVGLEEDQSYAMAVGDTLPDTSMARVARRVYAPRHADPRLAHAGFERVRNSYTAGLAQAVGRLIGHPPGQCPSCRLPAPTREQAMLRAALAVGERGHVGAALRALELLWRLR